MNKFSIKPYMKKYRWWIVLYVFLLVLTICLQIPSAILPAQLIVAVTEANYTLALKLAIAISVLYFAAMVVKIYITPMVFNRLSTDIGIDMCVAVAEQAFKISSAAYTTHNTSSFMQRIKSDPQLIFTRVMNIVEYATDMLRYAVIVIYMLTLNVWISICMVIYMVLSAVCAICMRKARINKYRVERAADEQVSSLINETIRSERDIKSLNLEGRLKELTVGEFQNYRTKVISCRKNEVGFRTLFNSLYAIFLIVFTTLGIRFLDLGMLTLSSFLILYSNRYNVDWISVDIANVMSAAADIKLSYERINELFENDEYVLEHFGDKHYDELESSVEFKNVKFAYLEYEDVNPEEYLKLLKQYKRKKLKEMPLRRKFVGKKQVFEDLSFKIEPNSTVAFVGKSGCGKSTVLNLISKLYTVDSGQVLIGGVNINELDKQTLRSSISLVNQFPYIFDMTIKENLLLAKPDATDAEIGKVVKDAALDEFIGGLTQGLDTRVGESGIKLSGGQKQRLAIARALLKNSRIIILDESTSSLDNLAQNTIKDSIDNIKGQSTIIIVAHRLSTIKNVDKIFFMENGKIVDSGTFKQLSKNNAAFKKMYDAEDMD